MRKNILIIAFVVALFSFGCDKKTIETELTDAPEAELSLKSAATGITVEPYADRSSYITGLSYLNPTQINLNRQATGGSAYTKVSGFNIPEENQARGILWSNNSSTDDERTNLWRPQGITGFTKNGVRYLLISWYALNSEEYNGSRVSLLDISPSSSNYLKYRHIILVHNAIPDQSSDYTQYGRFAPLDSHCGGMAYFNDKIYIASTGLGVRVFDINKIIEVNVESGSGTKCGEDSNGNLYAFGYRYILPQIGFYDINGGANPFSGLQINEEGNEIWTCQYYQWSDFSIVPKIYGFPLST